MNSRLQNQYTSIRSNNLQKVLHNEIELDTTWGQDIWGITLQIDLGDQVKELLTRYQSDLDKLEPGNLLLLPNQYQHISFNQVIFWGGNYEKGREETWNSIADDFLTTFQSLDKKYQSFEIEFSDLIATSGGIILCGYDENDELEKVREEFLQKLPFPPETTKLNHIIHTTVARFKNKLHNPQNVLEYINKQNEKTSMKVTKIVLRKELVFPSIKTEDIAYIELE